MKSNTFHYLQKFKLKATIIEDNFVLITFQQKVQWNILASQKKPKSFGPNLKKSFGPNLKVLFFLNSVPILLPATVCRYVVLKVNLWYLVPMHLNLYPIHATFSERLSLTLFENFLSPVKNVRKRTNVP